MAPGREGCFILERVQGSVGGWGVGGGGDSQCLGIEGCGIKVLDFLKFSWSYGIKLG